MLRLLAVVGFVLGASLPAGPAEGSVEAFIKDVTPASGVPGLAYAVVADGEITSGEGHGVLEIGGDRKVTPDTPFLTGSISKSFTALAVMQLVEAGEVDLDTEVSEYLDSFSDRPGGAVTVRQLLSHTSGFSTLQGNASHSDASGGEGELALMVDGFADVSPAYEPGHRWEYSNANYQILGRLIEVVSGHEYQTYVTTNILEPVGMDDSFISDGEIHESMATGHRPWFWTKRPLTDTATDRATALQGGIVASANDLARYMQMMMNGKDDVLSAEGSRWHQKATFISLVLLPPIYMLSISWAWRNRDDIRAKSGFSGLFSLWFPLLTTLGAALVMLWLMPNLMGAPLGTLALFQPDFGLALVATAVFGMLWAVFRLGGAYTGRSGPA